MIDDLRLSRPLRLAVQITRDDPVRMRSRLDNAVVFIRMAPEFEGNADAVILFQSLTDQLSRFCGAVVISGPADVTATCLARDREVHGTTARVRVEMRRPDAVTLAITVGAVARTPDEIVTCSDGWVGRVSSIEGARLLAAFASANPVGALTAAALTAGEAFLKLIGIDRKPHAFELSAWTGECSPVHSLSSGPGLPIIPAIDALVIGCGNVTNGWAKAVHALRLTGSINLVDRESLGEENLGPYAFARQDMVGQPKTLVLAEQLQPRLKVVRHDEELHLFVPRITRWDLPMPPLVINGLDNIEARHLAQRLWPEVLLDMAAGGTTSQVLMHCSGQDGQCLLSAFAGLDSGGGYARRIKALTGLRPDRFLNNFNTPITVKDVALAPPEHRARLEEAREAGQLMCGFINRTSLTTATNGEDFASAAPFVGYLTGARAAAITVSVLQRQGAASGLHWQYNFISNRARSVIMRCPDTCECRAIRRRPA
ncbi:MAG: ThiF family adenylyltransferase [Egibacteraceae bacterium]